MYIKGFGGVRSGPHSSSLREFRLSRENQVRIFRVSAYPPGSTSLPLLEVKPSTLPLTLPAPPSPSAVVGTRWNAVRDVIWFRVPWVEAGSHSREPPEPPVQPWKEYPAFNPIRERRAAPRLPHEQHSPEGGSSLTAAGGGVEIVSAQDGSRQVNLLGAAQLRPSRPLLLSFSQPPYYTSENRVTEWKHRRRTGSPVTHKRSR